MEFQGKDVYIGGVHPSYIPNQSLAQLNKISGPFSYNFPNKEQIESYRRQTFDPEKNFVNLPELLFCEVEISSLNLSSGRKIDSVILSSYISVYPSGAITNIFWLGLNGNVFVERELIELIALSRGTIERMDPSNKTSITYNWLGENRECSNVLDIINGIEIEFRRMYSANNSQELPEIRFTYPILYVGEVLGCDSAQEIIVNHQRPIAGLLNLWMNNTQFLKDKEISSSTAFDYHPFSYGSLYISTSCVVELHPKNVQRISDFEKQTTDEHHLRERTFLGILCELPVAQFYVLRVFDELLSSDIRRLQISKRAFYYPIWIIWFIRVIRLFTLKLRLHSGINEFRNIQLTRKSYSRLMMESLQSQFRTSALAESVDKKLAALDTIVNSTFNMYTAIFALVLSLLAIYVTITSTQKDLSSISQSTKCDQEVTHYPGPEQAETILENLLQSSEDLEKDIVRDCSVQ